MSDFFTFNSLNFFSLILLIVMFFHVKIYFTNQKEIDKKIWQSVVMFAIIMQILDISCWGVDGVAGPLANALSYILNILLFTSCTAANIALFFEFSAEYRESTYKKLKKLFNYAIGINALLCILSVKFGFIFYLDPQNVYIRGPLYFLMTIIMFAPVIVVLVRLLFKFSKTFNKVVRSNSMLVWFISINLILLVSFILLQGKGLTTITAIVPTITLSLFILHLLIIVNTIGTDYLTNLQNSFGVQKYFAALPKAATSYFTIVFFDLNDFKSINDNFGHREGDKALKDFAAILGAEIKFKDLGARVGGDEFIIGLITREIFEVYATIKNIQKDLDKYNESLKGYKLSFSYGVSTRAPNQEINHIEMIKEADAEMYNNKNSYKQMRFDVTK